MTEVMYMISQVVCESRGKKCYAFQSSVAVRNFLIRYIVRIADKTLKYDHHRNRKNSDFIMLTGGRSVTHIITIDSLIGTEMKSQ